MVQKRVPEIGEVVTAYRIKHPFTVVKFHEEIDAVKLKYPDGSLTRLIPLDAIEFISEKHDSNCRRTECSGHFE